MSQAVLQSLDRGLSVLELLSQTEHGLSLQELCDRLGMKPPTMHNLLRTLAGRGFVDKSSRPVRYRLGSAPQTLVQRHARRELIGRIDAELPKLVRALPVDQVQYAEPVGGDVLTIRRVTKAQPDLVQQPNTSLSPYNSASGLLFQAYWPPEERDAMRRQYPFDEHASRAWASLDDLTAYLLQVRQRGHAVAHPKQPTWAIAAPVTNVSGIVGALGMYRSGDEPLSENERQHCIKQLVDAATRLSTSPPVRHDEPDTLNFTPRSATR